MTEEGVVNFGATIEETVEYDAVKEGMATDQVIEERLTGVGDTNK